MSETSLFLVKILLIVIAALVLILMIVAIFWREKK